MIIITTCIIGSGINGMIILAAVLLVKVVQRMNIFQQVYRINLIDSFRTIFSTWSNKNNKKSSAQITSHTRHLISSIQTVPVPSKLI